MMTDNGTNETTLGCDPEKAFGEKLIASLKKTRGILADGSKTTTRTWNL